jgi:predicted dehydrogenase
VWGDAGSLVLDEADRLWGGKLGEPLGELTEAETLPTPPGMQYVSLWGLSFVRLVDHLVPAVLDGAPVAPAATFRDGVAVQRVLDAVRQSSRSGWVPV